MDRLTFQTSAASRWWTIAFFIGIIFSAVVRGFFPDAMPWSSNLPRGTQAVLRLFVGVLIGFALQTLWWAGRRVTRSHLIGH